MSPRMALPGAGTHPLVISTEILSCFPTLCRSHVSLVPHTVSMHTWGTSTLTPTCVLSACFSFAHSHPSPHLTHRAGLQFPSAGPLQPTRSFCPCSRPWAQLFPWNGLGFPFSGVVCGRALPESWGRVGERGIRNLNACLFSIPCAVHLSK